MGFLANSQLTQLGDSTAIHKGMLQGMVTPGDPP